MTMEVYDQKHSQCYIAQIEDVNDICKNVFFPFQLPYNYFKEGLI